MDKLLNAGWMTLEQIARLAVGFAVTTLVARHLGPEGFGVYAYLFGLAGLFAPLAMFGLEAVVMRRVAAAPERRGEVVRAALLLRAGGALAGAGAAVAVAALPGGPEGAGPALALLAAGVVLALPAETFADALKGGGRMAHVALPRIPVLLAAGGVALWLVWQGAGLAAFVALRAAEAAALGLAVVASYAALYRGGARAEPGRRLLRDCGRLAREGLPLMLAAVATLLWLRIDQVMLGHLAPAAELGLYGLAARLAELAHFLPVVIQASFYAAAVRVLRDEPARFEAYMQRVYDAAALAAWPAAIGLGLATRLLLVPVFGPAFAEAWPMIAVLLLSLPFHFLAVAWGMRLTVAGRLWVAPLGAMAATVLNIGLNAALIPAYGGIGAAWATVAAAAVAGLGAALVLPGFGAAGRGLARALEPVGAARRMLALWQGSTRCDG